MFWDNNFRALFWFFFFFFLQKFNIFRFSIYVLNIGYQSFTKKGLFVYSYKWYINYSWSDGNNPQNPRKVTGRTETVQTTALLRLTRQLKRFSVTKISRIGMKNSENNNFRLMSEEILPSPKQHPSIALRVCRSKCTCGNLQQRPKQTKPIS